MSSDLPEVEFTVIGTIDETPPDGLLCDVRAGSRVAHVLDGLVVVHPDEPPTLIRWNGETEELQMSDDGAVMLPPIEVPMTITQTINSLLCDAGLPRLPWDDLDDIEDIFE